MERVILTGARVFDGVSMRLGAVVIEDGRIAGIADTPPSEGRRIRLPGGTLAPGLIDLQVNGGGGTMLDGAATVDTIARLCAAHAPTGTTGLMPTLISDSAAATRSVLAAGIAATSRVPGFLGLHLEGPHLDPRRPGCHPPEALRPLSEEDIETLLEARTGLPALIVTLAPASASPEQIARLSAAGIIVALGHTQCTHAEAQAALAAGASMITHLFNAMSQLTAREPGLVGAALTHPVACGLIADGVHVHPATIRAALAAKPEGTLFLISDAMAVAGTGLTEFQLAGRRILRRDGALRLEDGTLAGADLSLAQAVRFLIGAVGVAPETALAMASYLPARLIGAQAGRIAPGLPADLVLFDDDWRLMRVWRRGAPVQTNSSTE